MGDSARPVFEDPVPARPLADVAMRAGQADEHRTTMFQPAGRPQLAPHRRVDRRFGAGAMIGICQGLPTRMITVVDPIQQLSIVDAWQPFASADTQM
jgi:hypothetical protein